MAAVNNPQNETRLVVGVDYGTTYRFGVAWSHTGYQNIESIAVINSWPGAGNTNEAKTPSVIAYGTGPDFPKGFRWGSDIPTRAPRHVWIKLLLNSPNGAANHINRLNNDPSFQNKTRFTPPAGFMALPPNKTAVDVVADYLAGLYEHAMEKLVLAHGKEMIDVTPIEFVLTVPAIWSHKAQVSTKEAAKRAGFASREQDKIRLVSEPEAAAIYTIRSTYERNVNLQSLQVGDHFVMCDAGGGTVDLISYEVVQTNPLKIAEVVIGSGGNCGSTFIDSQFQNLLEKRLGPSLQSIPMTKRGPGSRLMSEFETVKRGFGTGTGTTRPMFLTLNVPNNAKAGINDGEFELQSDELKETFTPVIKDIISLLSEQINSIDKKGGKIKYIFLVGGFGESDYLLKCLKENTWGTVGQLEIIRPPQAWSAVSRGAVLWGLEGDLVVDTRKCRRHYGTELLKHFDPQIHNEVDAMISTFTGLKMARNQLSWIINKGDEMGSQQQFKLSCVTSFHKGEKLIHQTQLIACDADDAPTNLKDNDVYDLCMLTADLSNVPEYEFDECQIGNKTFLRAEFSIEMTFQSAEIKFETWFKGKCYGAVKTKY